MLNAGESVVTDPDAAEALDPTDRSLHDPSYSPETASVILSPTSDDWLDALCTQGVPSRLAVVSAICEENIRMAAWPATLPGRSGKVGDCGEYLSVITGIRRCGVDDERHAVSIHDESVLRAQFPAVNGAWASGLAAAEGTDHDAVDDRQIGFKDACVPEQSEEVHVEIVPHPGFVPSPQPSVSGAARASKFEWHVFPPATCHQHVPKDLDHGTVRTRGRPPSRPTGSSGGSRRSNSANNASSMRAPAILAPSMGHETMKGPCLNHVPNEVWSGPIIAARRPTEAEMTESDRQSICERIATDKRRLGLPLADVRRVDEYLADQWGITMPLPPEQWRKRLVKLAGRELAAAFTELHDEQAALFAAEAPVPEALETAFYEVIADPRISGLVHSQKRTEILDAACLLLHLIRELCITGPVLDVGCHVGYHACLLSKEARLPVHGIDLSARAIEAARANAVAQPGLTFSTTSLDHPGFAQHFEMIYAVRSLDFDRQAAARVAAALQPGGVALIMPQDPPSASRRARSGVLAAGFGWGFSDVVGGWIGEDRGYMAGPVFVLIKGGDRDIPADFVESAQAIWNEHFRPFANDPGTPWAEKTQAYSRAKWIPLHGLRPGVCHRVLVQGARGLPVLQWQAHGADRRAPCRSRDSTGAGATVGDLRAEAITGFSRRSACGRRRSHENLH